MPHIVSCSAILFFFLLLLLLQSFFSFGNTLPFPSWIIDLLGVIDLNLFMRKSSIPTILQLYAFKSSNELKVATFTVPHYMTWSLPLMFVVALLRNSFYDRRILSKSFSFNISCDLRAEFKVAVLFFFLSHRNMVPSSSSPLTPRSKVRNHRRALGDLVANEPWLNAFSCLGVGRSASGSFTGAKRFSFFFFCLLSQGVHDDRVRTRESERNRNSG